MNRRSFLFWALLIVASALHVQCTKDDENGTGGGKGNGGGGGNYISYADYGAVGDGLTDDLDAIIRAHEAANMMGWPVRAVSGKTYYIGGADKSVPIQTDTDWTGAKFNIDDRNVENRSTHVFVVSSKLPSKSLTSLVTTLKKNQEQLSLTLEQGAVIVATDNKTERYIRTGGSTPGVGSDQTDVFVVDKNGKVDMNAPIIWDFKQISSMTAYPIDDETLTIKGGYFTTIATQTNWDYYARGISIRRSNVVVDGIKHAVIGEKTGKEGPPYNGFIAISSCANVRVENSEFTGRRYYDRGSYDLNTNRTVNVTFLNCKQMNSIHDDTYWGIFASNFSKNTVFDKVEFSRFDAHQGVANATIRNSKLGYMGCSIIGSGTFLIENTKVYGDTRFITLRSDYGSTWEGEIIIRDCEYFPKNGAQTDVTVITGSNNGSHNYGYTCYMPHTITIDGLTIHDTNTPSGYKGPKLLAAFNNSWKAGNPYVVTQEVKIRNLVIKSGKEYILSANTGTMFNNVKTTLF